MFLLFQQQCAVLLLEQQRVVRPRGAQLAGVVLLLEQQQLFCLEALSLQALCFCFFCSDALLIGLEQGVVALLLFQQRCAVLLLEQQRVVRPRGAPLPGVALLLFQQQCALVRP